MGDPCLPLILANRTSRDDNPVIRDTNRALAILCTIYVFVSYARFMHLKPKLIHLQKRSAVYTTITFIGVLIYLLGGPYTGGWEYPCWVVVASSMLVVPLVGLPIPLRMLDHFAKYVYARGILGLNVTDGNDNEDEDDTVENNNNNVEGSPGKKKKDEDTWFSASKSIALLFYSTVARGGGGGNDRKNVRSTELAASREGDASRPSSAQRRKHNIPKPISMKSLLILKFLTSSAARVIVSVVLIFPFILIIVVDFMKEETLFPVNACSRGCFISSGQSLAIFVGGGLIIGLGIFIAVLVRKYADPFGIMTECRIYVQYGGLMAIIGFALSRSFNDKPGMVASFSYITVLGMMIIQFVTTDMQIIIARRKQTKIHEFEKTRRGKTTSKRSQQGSSISPNEEGSLSIVENMLESSEVRMFEEYLVAEHSVELLRMYQDCMNFEKSFYDVSENTRRTRARRIYTMYIDESSPLEVNLPFSIKETIKAAVYDSPDPIPVDTFKASRNEILAMLYGPWIRYLAHEDTKSKKQVQTT